MANLPTTTDETGKTVAARPIRMVAGLTATNEVGQTVDVLPIRTVVGTTASDAAGKTIATLPVSALATTTTTDELGRAVGVQPAREVAALSTTDAAGRIVDVVPVRAIGGTPTPTPTPAPSPTALYDLNFATGTYTGTTLSNMLSEAGNFVGGLYEQESDGSLTAVGASVIQRTGNGLEVWPDRTNVVLWNRDLTNAAWTASNVTALKNQTGKNGSANAASSITATADGGTIRQAITLASSARMQSAFVKRLVGVGTLEMTTDGGTTWTTVTVTASYTRVSVPTQTLANPSVGFRIGTSGDSFAIDYVQNENSNTVTPPIATTTVAVNRPQNRATCLNKAPLRDLVKGDVFAVYWEGKMDVAGGRSPFVSDANFTFSTSTLGKMTVGTAASPDGAVPFGTYFKFCLNRDAGGAIRLSINGGAVFAGTMASNAALTHFDIATNGAGASNIRGIVKRVAFFSSLTDAQMIALTA